MYGEARRGEIGRGEIGHGLDTNGIARKVGASPARWFGATPALTVRSGDVRSGVARLGLARCGLARRGRAWQNTPVIAIRSQVYSFLLGLVPVVMSTIKCI